MEIKCYATHYSASLPVYGTESSACFDIFSAFYLDLEIKGYGYDHQDIDGYLLQSTIPMKTTETITDTGILSIGCNERYLIPTGLIFDIPAGHHMKIYSRSSLACKRGLVIPNSVGIIDEDYTCELFVPVHNVSGGTQYIGHGDRIAQGEIVKTSTKNTFVFTDTKIAQKTDRAGGVGSTGK